MREKQDAFVMTFHSTTDALAAESYCRDHGLPGRIIPVPRELTAGCGLAWKAPVEEAARLTQALEAAGLPWAEARVLRI